LQAERLSQERRNARVPGHPLQSENPAGGHEALPTTRLRILDRPQGARVGPVIQGIGLVHAFAHDPNRPRKL